MHDLHVHNFSIMTAQGVQMLANSSLLPLILVISESCHRLLKAKQAQAVRDVQMPSHVSVAAGIMIGI